MSAVWFVLLIVALYGLVVLVANFVKSYDRRA